MIRRPLSIAAVGTATVLVVALTCSVAHARQGVDQVGRYFYQDSAEFDGFFLPVTAGIDAVADFDDDDVPDNGTHDVTLPFPFRFYDQARTTLTIGANGALRFPGGTPVSFSNGHLVTSRNNVMVAPWWDDWDPSSAGEVLYGTSGAAPNRVFVVWWKDVVHYGDDPEDDGTVSFQAQLFEGSSVIEFHYLDTETTATEGIRPVMGGGTGTVGLDNGVSSALQYSTDPQAPLSDGLAIRFTPATCEGSRVTRLGSFGSDSLNLGSGDDVVLALSGDDIINTGGGSDRICAGDGNDTIASGAGSDEVLGETGTDQIDTGAGSDFASGGSDEDQLILGAGSDRGVGGSGDDVLRGQDGPDTLEGGADDDELHGGGATDRCKGGQGSDRATTCEIRSSIP